MEFLTTIIASGGFAGETLDIAVGPLVTDAIDILLTSSSPTGPAVLQENAPLVLLSTGSLSSPRGLDISGVENDGRFFFLSVQNDDLDVNSLTITSSSTLNNLTELIITSPGDYVFTHNSGGVWRVQAVYTPEEKSNLELQMAFRAAQLTNYKQLLYTGNNLTTVNIYEDNTLANLLFTKSLSYTGNNLTSVVLTRISDGAIVTKTLSYTGSKLNSVETL